MQDQKFLVKLKKHYDHLDQREQAVVEPLFAVNKEKIDEKRSNIKEGKAFLKINLVSKVDACCPLSIWIGSGESKKKVYLLFGEEDGDRQIDLLSYEDIGNEEGLLDVEETVNEILRSYIHKRDVLINGELAKRVLTSSAFQFSDGELIPFSRTYKRTWSWRHKESSRVDYQPWIENEASSEEKLQSPAS